MLIGCTTVTDMMGSTVTPHSEEAHALGMLVHGYTFGQASSLAGLSLLALNICGQRLGLNR